MSTKPINFLRLFNYEGKPVRDHKVAEKESPVDSAELLFRNQGVEVIQFITGVFDTKGKLEENVLLTVHREDLPELKENGFCFFVKGNEPDPDAPNEEEDDVPIYHSEIVKPSRNVGQIQAKFLFSVVQDHRFHKLTIQEANDLSEMLADALDDSDFR